MQIHKYTLDQLIHNIDLPVGSSVLKIDQQRDEIKMWVLKPNGENKERRIFRVYTPGMDVPMGLDYLGSALLENGTFVFHVFEDKRVVK